MGSIALSDSKWLKAASLGVHLVCLVGVLLMPFGIVWSFLLTACICLHFAYWWYGNRVSRGHVQKLVFGIEGLHISCSDGQSHAVEIFELVICTRYLLVLRIGYLDKVQFVPVVRDMVASDDQWRQLCSWRVRKFIR